jgi:hypothetical protein
MIRPFTINKAPHFASAVPFRNIAWRLILIALVLLYFLQSRAMAMAFEEYQLKAVFLYRLSLFITWPKDAFKDSNQPFVIGILGEDPFGPHIDKVVQNERVKKRPIQVRRFARIDDVLKEPCQILFISKTYRNQWPELIHKLDKHAMLTVSDMAQFSQMGGMVNIWTQNSRIRIDVNSYETRRAGLIVSSKLLKVAHQVKTGSQRMLP